MPGVVNIKILRTYPHGQCHGILFSFLLELELSFIFYLLASCVLDNHLCNLFVVSDVSFFLCGHDRGCMHVR